MYSLHSWTYVIEGITILFGIFFNTLFFVFFLLRLMARIKRKRKGYNSPIEMNIVGIAYIALFVVGIYFGAQYSSNFTESIVKYFNINDSNINQSISMLLLFLLSLILIILTFLAINFILYLLPSKNLRKAGQRIVRFPFAVFCHLFWITGVVLIPLAWIFDWRNYSLYDSFKWLFQVWLPASFGCYMIAKRAKSPSIAQVKNTDSWAPVLYLRSFDQEEQLFAEVARMDIDEYTMYSPNVPILNLGVTLEQYFSKQINQTIGPFFALGNPEDYVAPEGANRLYAADTNWKTEFHKLCHQSACIIMQPGASENLIWELQAILNTSLIEKFFILTSPAQKSGWWFGLCRKIYVFSHTAMNIKKTSWSEFIKILGEAGYKLDANEPSPGSVLAFDEYGNNIVIKTNAVSPAEYITAIQERIGNRKKDNALITIA